MLQISALLIFLLSLLTGGAATATCTSQSWEDRSAVHSCAVQQHRCTARIDAETQKISSLICE